MAYNGKRLHKSDSDKKLCGVCGGIAEYFNIDPTIVRLGWIIFCLAGGSGVLADFKQTKRQAASHYGAPLCCKRPAACRAAVHGGSGRFAGCCRGWKRGRGLPHRGKDVMLDIRHHAVIENGRI